VLTLTRSVGERIVIGDDIVIEVRAILDSHQVRIAVQAPRQVPVHRAELLEAISRENQDALSAGSDNRLLDALGQAVSAAGAGTAGAAAPTAVTMGAAVEPLEVEPLEVELQGVEPLGEQSGRAE